jgi:CO/xanthine dehydrogenase Mo-binding subunit
VSEFSVIGHRLPKVNTWDHLTGRAKYADDIFLPRMLYGRLLRSPHAHARIVSIDVSRALAHPGVIDIVLGPDMPELMGIMPSTQDETALAVGKVRYVGEPVAAVAAVDEDTAFEALGLIDVEYEALTPILTIQDALRDDLPKLHAHSKAGQRLQGRAPGVRRHGRGIRCRRSRARRLVLLRRQYPRADRNALVGGVLGRRRQADAVVGNAGAALPAPRAGEGAGASRARISA